MPAHTLRLLGLFYLIKLQKLFLKTKRAPVSLCCESQRFQTANIKILSANSKHRSSFWATVCKTVRPVLSDRCPVCLSSPVCDVGVLWPNGLTHQDETWRAGRPRPWPDCVRWGPSYPPPKGHSPPIFGPYPLWPNGCIDQDTTWYGGRPRPR